MSSEKPILNVPKVESVEYSRNVIKTAVCELRFPTLLSLEDIAPVAMQKALRKEYPIYEVQERAEIRNIESIPGHFRYMFYEKKRRWTISINATSMSLETNSYTNFEEFEKRLIRLLDVSRDIIDSDFFTRVGMRYINSIPVEDSDLNGWINDSILSGLNKEVYGFMEDYESIVRGYTSDGKYTFRHGLNGVSEESGIKYALDVDYFMEDVSSEDVVSLVKKYNEINFSFFRWSIGPKTIEYMGEEKPKKGK
jgi:uncharacterized protein (TIGR04255 family)